MTAQNLAWLFLGLLIAVSIWAFIGLVRQARKNEREIDLASARDDGFTQGYDEGFTAGIRATQPTHTVTEVYDVDQHGGVSA